MTLGDSGCRYLAEELTNNTTLTKLNLEGFFLKYIQLFVINNVYIYV